MANWKYKINVGEKFHKAKMGEITYKELATQIVKELRRLNITGDDELDDIIESFEMLSDEDDTEEFDYILSDLFDWGDIEVEPLNQWPPNKMCWIGTF